MRKLITSAYGFCSAFSAVKLMAVSLTVNLIAISILLIGSCYPSRHVDGQWQKWFSMVRRLFDRSGGVGRDKKAAGGGRPLRRM